MSLLFLLLGFSLDAFASLKAQELLPKGELINLHNPIKTGIFAKLPQINVRLNDIWLNYKSAEIHQYYSNFSILSPNGNEIEQKTISVNNPLHFNKSDLYQSDWNLVGIRVKKTYTNQAIELPLFFLNKGTKSWITWIEYSHKNYSLIFNQLHGTFLIYDSKGFFIGKSQIGQNFFSGLLVSEILPSAGILIKVSYNIFLIYLGFGFLMITASLSCLPYTQLWIFYLSLSNTEDKYYANPNKQNSYILMGGKINRGKFSLEVKFENLVRDWENLSNKNNLI